MNIFRTKFAIGSALLRPNLVSIRGWCAANLLLTKQKSATLQGKLIQISLINNIRYNSYQLRERS